MWKLLRESEAPLYISFIEDFSGFEILVTNYISLWCVNFTKECFIRILKECNKDLECDSDNEFLQQGVTLLKQPEKIKKLQVEREDGDRTLSICMDVSFGYPFRFECKLAKTSEQMFCKKVTLPLLKVIKDLHASQTKLREKLKRKDKVIKAYQDKGAKLTARRLKSDEAAFNEIVHMSKHKEFEEILGENFDTGNMLTKLEQSAILNEHTNVTFKIEPGLIKTETNEATAIPNIASMTIKQEDITDKPILSNIAVKRQRRRLNI